MPVFLSQNPFLRKLYRYTKSGMVSEKALEEVPFCFCCEEEIH